MNALPGEPPARALRLDISAACRSARVLSSRNCNRMRNVSIGQVISLVCTDTLPPPKCRSYKPRGEADRPGKGLSTPAKAAAALLRIPALSPVARGSMPSFGW